MLKKVIYIFALLIVLLSSCRQEKEELSICFTGDVLLDRGVRKQIERTGVETLFEDVSKIFKKSDAVVVNLECPITKTVSPINKRFIFRGEPEWIPALKAAGITHAALANNHSMDQGREGLRDTYKHLSENQIISLGYGENRQSACKPVFVKKGSTEVALFNSVTIPLENWVYLEDKAGVCQMGIDDIATNIGTLKKAKPDCNVVVILHWGLEYQQLPTPLQRSQARQLIDAGADAVIGHHPHIIQKEEIYKDKPIFYSLGNFVFDQKQPMTRESVIVELLFDDSGIRFVKYPVEIRSCKPTLR